MHINFYLKNKDPIYCLLIIPLLGLLSIILFFSFRDVDVSASSEQIELPIIMYHSLSDSWNNKSKYVISPKLFEEDLKFIKEKGYTPIFVKDLIKYVYNEGNLPNKPIMLTFDDGYYNNFVYAYPLSVKYNSKIIISPIIKCTERYSEIKDTNINYSHITWENINEMIKSGYVEIQNHTYDLHSSNKNGRLGAARIYNEGDDHYKRVITQDILKAQEKIQKNINITPDAFVYPFGAVGKSSKSILKDIGFRCTIGCTSRINKISKDPECLYNLCRFIRFPNIQSEKYFEKIIK